MTNARGRFLTSRASRGSARARSSRGSPSACRSGRSARGDARAGRYTAGRADPRSRAARTRRKITRHGRIAAHVRGACRAPREFDRAELGGRAMGPLRSIHRCDLRLSGRGTGFGEEGIRQMETLVQGRRRPDLTLLLDVPVNVGLTRARHAMRRTGLEGAPEDRFERSAPSSSSACAPGYLARASAEPAAHGGDRCQPTIDGWPRRSSSALRVAGMDFLIADSLPWLRRRSAHARALAAGTSAAGVCCPHRARSRRGTAGELDHRASAVRVAGRGAVRRVPFVRAVARGQSSGFCTWCGLAEDAQQIKVDQIRALIETLSLSSYRGGYKVASSRRRKR